MVGTIWRRKINMEKQKIRMKSVRIQLGWIHGFHPRDTETDAYVGLCVTYTFPSPVR